MKVLPILLFSLSVTSLYAQASAAPPNACGPNSGSYKVQLSYNDVIPAPSPGMATIVFVEDQIQQRPGHAPCIGGCTTQMRFGMDGQWLAVAAGFSHLAVSIAPGDHHFCASADSTGVTSLYGLHVEAGKTYFFQGRLTLDSFRVVPIVDLSLLNDDEGLYMVSITKHSSFTPKK